MRKHSLIVFPLALVIGWWLGEDCLYLPAVAAQTSLIVPRLFAQAAFFLVSFGAPAIVALALAVVAWRLAPAQSRRHRVAVLLVLLTTTFAAFLGASIATSRAFNECVARGEQVRGALAAYRISHGAYPARLSDLPGASIPGRRFLHRNLLQYHSSGASYELSFRDFLVLHQATDKSPFFAIE